jgi:potassium channel subfamily K
MEPTESPGKSDFSQAYYYAIFSSALSFTAMLCVLLHGLGVIRKYYTPQPEWSPIQRALFRQSIALTVYLLIGAIIFAAIEGWAFLNALFWADFTLLTIGLGGEFTPKTIFGRALTLPYTTLGIVWVALLVVSVRKLMNRAHLRVTTQLTERRLNQLQATLVNATRERGPMINKHTFNQIRRIETRAEITCKLIVLTASVIAALLILLGGAAVFKLAEAYQGWTYGSSCYFAYISLLTVGYGDYIPSSEIGKSFFVLWSLLAVPTLTIFINNSVDALYGSCDSLLSPFQRFLQCRRCQPQRIQQSVQRTADTTAPSAEKDIENMGSGGACISQQMLSHFKNDGPSQNSRNMSNNTSRLNRRLHCCLLAQELRNILLDMKSQGSKKYTYEEWCYYVNLLGPFTEYQGQNNVAEESHDYKGKSKIYTELPNSSSFPPTSEAIQWVSQKSPLLCSNESEWLSMRLSSRLMGISSWLVAQDHIEN